jgi:chaperonin GroEL
MKEKKARVEDAMHATKAAVEEGIVPGGGVALLRTIPALDRLLAEDKGLPHDVRIGIELTRRAIEEPARWIAANAGQEGNIVVAQVKSAKDFDHGYNAQADKFENLTDAGVIDPTKVVRTALQNASSIAALMLTTEAVVAEIPEKKKDAPPSPGMDDY